MITNKIRNKTLRQLIIDHNNNYGFDVKRIINNNANEFASLSVILPFYNDKKIINLTLKHLYNSLNKVKEIDSKWTFEVIIIDDGSEESGRKYINRKSFTNLKIIRHRKNGGRTAVRNTGLSVATNKLCLFMDSDILIDVNLILNHLKVHEATQKKNKKAITIGFFEFSNTINFVAKKNEILPEDIRLNDFRINCIYQKGWFGCENDKKYIGHQFNILQQTDMLKRWPKSGFLGPWFLTNMVLGGFFMVDTKQAKKVKGFSSSFTGYGFTETSLPTKLLAAFNNYIIPVPFVGGLHIEQIKSSLKHERAEKNRLFRKRHDYYFNNYLQLTLKKAIAEAM